MQHKTDWNCGLLPRSNDGVDSSKGSANAILELFHRHGIDRFCLLPEWVPDEQPLSVFLLRSRLAHDALVPLLPKAIKLRLASRVLLTPDLHMQTDLERLTLGIGGYLSVQFPISDYADWMDTELNRLLYKCHFRLLLSSFEFCLLLYPPEIIEKLLRIPQAVYQFGYRSLTEPSVCRVIKLLLKENRTVLLGTGLYSASKLNDFELATYEQALAANLSPIELQALTRRSERFWKM